MDTGFGDAHLCRIVAGATGWRRRTLAPATPARPAPKLGGAYALVLWLERQIVLRNAQGALEKGAYVYAGSAYGPGGLGARLARHLGRPRAIHWHIDQLTVAAHAKLGFPQPGGTECAIVQRLMDTGEFTQPIHGFGATDCRACASHLLRWVG